MNINSYINNLPNNQVEYFGTYTGVRGEEFRQLIISLLKRANIKDKYIDVLTDESGMEKYAQAFTAASADSVNNYEFFEQLGDVTANKFIVWYIYRRFPELMNPEGVEIVARIRINYGARQTFFEIANRLNFWPYISASEEERNTKKKDLLEDSLESFIGVTEFLIDTRIRVGVGYSIAYDILGSVFDGIRISTKWEDLLDEKTRLKEIFDQNKEELGPKNLEYTETKEPGQGTISTVWRKFANGTRVEIGRGYAALKADAQQKAAAQGIETLRKQGFIWQKKKKVPKIVAQIE
jgi:dsRNA-specific ribonuclease|uniref:RNase III domain-containing protein n=1 Tax=viral metagenome TaxID=1070528 RepID=A0A6C0CYY8_9ZZZZ